MIQRHCAHGVSIRWGLVLSLVFLAQTGACVVGRARQAVPACSPSDSQPSTLPQIAQQSGQVNAAIQTATEAPGWKAIEYHTDLPWKSVVLLVSYVVIEAVKQSFIVYLSHRREMRRIANGRRDNGSLHLHS